MKFTTTFLISLCVATATAQNFGQLLGKSTIKKAEREQKIFKREDSNEVLDDQDGQSIKEFGLRRAKQDRTIENEIDNTKFEVDLDLDKSAFAKAFGFSLRGQEGRARSLEPNTLPSRAAFGFDKRPMSFRTNFDQEVQFDNPDDVRLEAFRRRPRVKREASELGGLDHRLRFDDLEIAASAQRPHALTPQLISSMFQRQLFLQEDHRGSGLPTHDAVPVVAQAGAAHPHINLGNRHHAPAHHVQPVAVAHHPQPHRHEALTLHPQRNQHLTLGRSHHFVHEHRAHPVQPVHHAQPVVHHAQPVHHAIAHPVAHAPHQVSVAPLHHVAPVTHHTAFKGYAPPIHGGGSLENIFGLHNGRYVAPVPTPAASYHVPSITAAYSPPPKPAPVYKEPLVVAPVHHVEPDYRVPHKGHPFSMEMVFGLPMPMHYMKKYRHMLPFHSPTPKYNIVEAPTPVYTPTPVAAYKEPEPVYHDPATHYISPAHGGTLEDVFGIASKYHTPQHVAPAYAPLELTPAYHPEPEYHPAEVKHMPGYQNHYDHNSYSLHYMPYQDYEPVHPESIAIKSRVPSIPGAAHFLTRAPHPHLGSIQSRHPTPHHRTHHTQKRAKRSAQGSSPALL